MADDNETPLDDPLSSAVTTVIGPPRRFLPHLGVRSLWRYRAIALVLASREFKARYKQSFFGVAWAVAQPLAAAALFTVVFGRVAGLGPEGEPYLLFALVGMVVWNYVSTTVTEATKLLVSSPELVTKVYFPRLLAPLSSALPPVVDLAVGLVVVATFMVVYTQPPTLALLTFPLWLMLLMICSLGPALWFAATNVKYRDTASVLVFLLQLWFFASPIVYTTEALGDGAAVFSALNPLVVVLEGFRWSLLGGDAPSGAAYIGVGLSALVFVGGLYYFRRLEQFFADLV